MNRKVTTSTDPAVEKFWADLVSDWTKTIQKSQTVIQSLEKQS